MQVLKRPSTTSVIPLNFSEMYNSLSLKLSSKCVCVCVWTDMKLCFGLPISWMRKLSCIKTFHPDLHTHVESCWSYCHTVCNLLQYPVKVMTELEKKKKWSNVRDQALFTMTQHSSVFLSGVLATPSKFFLSLSWLLQQLSVALSEHVFFLSSSF